MLEHVELEITITQAEDGLAAEILLEEECFDIIFTDINMPGMDGIQLLQKWHMLLPNTQWAILSGISDFEYAQQAISMGVKEYLLKPVTKVKMLLTLERFLQNIHIQKGDFISLEEQAALLKKLEENIWTLHKPETEISIDNLIRKR